MVAGKPARRRRLVRWQDLDPRGGRRRFVFDNGDKSEVTPIRFVCACENGHLQDIDWKWIAHEGEPCQESMWVEEKGTSADPADMTIVSVSGELSNVQSVQDMAAAKRFNSKVAATLGPYSDDDIFARLQRLRDGAIAEAGGSPKLSEFEVFASGRREIGHNSPAAKLYAQTLPRDEWADSMARVDLSAIKNVVAVPSFTRSLLPLRLHAVRGRPDHRRRRP
jgi:hypothetical protein